MEKKLVENKIVVERETYERNGKNYFSYFIKGNIRGKDVRVLLAPLDNGGFAVLDIVFGNDLKADLVLNPYEMKDSSGRIIKGNTYAVRSVDEDGTVYECKVKPFRVSDKALLNMLLSK